MIKRTILTLALALLVAGMSVAEVRVKALDDVNVEIVFTWKDDAATEMAVIGTFNNWVEPGVPMTRNAEGLWEYTLKGTVADEIAYKIFNKGTYIFDAKAPDKKDDGFGGNNGLIIVADVLAGIAPGQLAATGSGDSGLPVANTYPSKLNFGMFTVIGSKTTFVTQGLVDKTVKGLETDSTGLYGKSYWKVGGTLWPSVTGWFEMKAFDGYKAVWAQDATGLVNPELDAGLAGLASGLLFNPVNWLGGAKPVLNSIKTGFETPYLVWETGYGYAKPQKRTAILWETLNERDGNDGYMRFDLGPELRKLGGLAIEAAVAPNKMSGNYGFFGWFGASAGDLKLDFQYDFKSAATDDLSAIFDKLYHQDLLFGAKYKLAGVNLAAQGLVNLFSEEAFGLDSHVAGELKADWALPADAFGFAASYRYTGSMAEMLFGNGDSLGDKGSQRAYLNLWGKPLPALKLGLDSSATLDHLEMPVLDLQLYGKPYVEYDLSGLVGKKSSINAYAKAKYLIHEGFVFTASGSNFLLGEAGAKLWLDAPVPGVVNSLDAYLGFNNWSEDDDKSLTTLVLAARMPKDLSAELGFGVRVPRASASAAEVEQNNWLGASIGASWKVPKPALKSPLLYGAFAWNMDPYDSDGN
ncbi:MAG TPA: glycogen-binding domain-containing protein, partial [Spirochaetales bacterium]|nr:glycogen-binding domain-containing protein [Spirochaetales bacterium]